MDEDRTLDVAGGLEGLDETVEAMPLDGADVMKVERLKEHPRGEEGRPGSLRCASESEGYWDPGPGWI